MAFNWLVAAERLPAIARTGLTYSELERWIGCPIVFKILGPTDCGVMLSVAELGLLPSQLS